MAARDDSPTSLHGQPWSVWADRLGRDSPLSDTGERSSVPAKESDAMKLPKKDMSYYGLCPVRDEFYLVTCNYCQRVCTPQGLKNHIEMKHAQEWHPQPNELLDGSVIPTSQVGPQATLSTVSSKVLKTGGGKKVSSTATVNNSSGSLAALLASPAVPTSKQSRSNKRGPGGGTGKSGGFSQGAASSKIPTALSSALTGTPYDKIPSPQQPPPSTQQPAQPCATATAPPQFSPLQPMLTAPSPVSPLTAGGVLTPSPAITMTVAVDSSGVQTVQIHLPEISNGVMLPNSPTDLVEAVPPTASTPASAGTPSASRSKKRKSSKSERRLLPLKEREFDPEKHCGVWMSEVQKPCTRSLTCKAHSLTLRRAVQGRSRPFDDLLAEHRAAKEVLMRQLKDGAIGTVAKASPSSPVAVRTPSAAEAAVAVKPRALLRTPSAGTKRVSLSSLLQPSQTELTVEVPAAENSPHQQLPSGGLLQRVFQPATSQGATLPAACHLSFTSHHPKPLAVCSFGLRRSRISSQFPQPHHNSARSAEEERKWDYIRTTLRSTFQQRAHKLMGGSTVRLIAPGGVGMQSLLRPSNHLSTGVAGGLATRGNIELPNGLQLSIGLKSEGHSNSNHRIRFKKSLANGLTPGSHQRTIGVTGQSAQPEQSTSLMDGFDGLVGEDGVLTFVNQGTEGSASLSLMADLSAGNITFSEMMSDPAAAAAAIAAAAAAAASGGGLTLPSTTLSHTQAPPPPGPLPPRILLQSPTGAGLLLQPDPGDQMMM